MATEPPVPPKPPIRPGYMMDETFQIMEYLYELEKRLYKLQVQVTYLLKKN